MSVGVRQLLLALLSVTAVGTAVISQAKTETPSDSVVVWEGEKSQWVRLEPRDDHSAPANEHPAQISAAVLAAVLASLSVTDDEETTPVFNAEESAQLGAAVSQALAQATSGEDVTFRTAGANATTGAFKFVRVNTGRIFEQGGKLNVIFGDVHAKAKKKTIYGHATEDFSKPRPASRTSSKKYDWVLVLPPGAELQRTRGDWVAFDSAQLATVAAAAPAAPAAAPGTAPPPPVPPAGAIAPPPATPSGASPEADMERRLRKLKDLHDQGLITDEAYKAKVEEILSVL